MDWIYLEHKDHGGSTRVPDEPGVLDWHLAHGWVEADEPEAVPFVPPKGDLSPTDEWVVLTHPVTGGVHEFPNDPAALQGAYELGWQLPKPVKAAKKSASVAPATDNDEVKE